MEISLDMIKDKVECLQAYDFRELERAIEERIGMNKALMLRVKQVQHQVTFDPFRNKMLYSAIVHFNVD
ncbi:DUF2536 family protein [Paenibacillus sp. FSL K6-1122]|uniref:DUF2536 domain-containing protein n=1 Tax=Paenibacillus xylanexedens TaxID=528191 RepID=A0ABS4RVN1_PAEXY|nr:MULTISPECIES: DUF2536 family protein [Paenibacillus]UOK64354.1 YrzA family protein [Paenibacillus sp. OVF10]MBP2246491.1 hypothetical protein [Paenibacillus xylanexedens]MCL6663766.1 YrzA family protein [Paenibacillus amylolyticus]OME93249.1 hypothetical protein BK124_25120 [Paenibacillus amylolyticus]OMF61639.1 hypothetical protein BK141_20900 [Paenibacillus sp. FSL R5-0765]